MAKNVQYITPRCMGCHKQEIITLNENDYLRWQNGEHVQNVWPQFSAEDRELLITGTHPACWNAMFADEEDD